MVTKKIETKRMILRPLTIDDAYDVFEWAGDAIVNKYMPYPLHKDVHQSAEWIHSLGDKNEFCFCLKDTGKVIGSGSIVYRAEYEAYEIGYNLNRKFWGIPNILLSVGKIDFSSHPEMGKEFEKTLLDDNEVNDAIYSDGYLWILWR